MDTLRLGLEWFLNPDHVPFLVARELGWLDEAGLDLILVEPAEHLDAIDAITSGQLDLAVTEPIHLVQDLAEGKPVVGFARFLHTNGGVMYLAGSGITRPADMAGKRVQYPGAPGPGGPAIVRTMIAADGGDAAAPLTPVNNSFYHTAALLEDKADVATLAFYNFEVVEARHKGHDARFFALKDWGVPDFCQLILITTPALLAQRGPAIKKLLAILQRGADFIHQHPAQARAIYFKHAGLDPADPLMSAIFDATVPCFTFDLDMPHAYYAHLAAWMRRHDLIHADLDPAACWDSSLLYP